MAILGSWCLALVWDVEANAHESIRRDFGLVLLPFVVCAFNCTNLLVWYFADYYCNCTHFMEITADSGKRGRLELPIFVETRESKLLSSMLVHLQWPNKSFDSKASCLRKFHGYCPMFNESSFLSLSPILADWTNIGANGKLSML